MDAESLSMPDVEAILSYAALGLIVGFGYYMSMRLDSGVMAGVGPRWLPLLIHGLRIAAAIGVFAWLASLGMLPILAAFAGFLLGRVIAFRALGEDV